MNYQDARLLIETGDLIEIRDAHGLLGKMTQFFTRKPYTHTGIAIWIADGLWMAELNGGRNHLIPLSQLEDIRFDVFYPPLEDRAEIEKAILYWLRFKVEYGYLAFIAIGLLDYFSIDKFVKWRNILVCSGYCVAIYQRAGWKAMVSRVISPGRLASLLTLKLSVSKM